LTKWTGFTSASASIGDSNIFEDKFGKVGIGTALPTSLLTVQGTIETTQGGIRFPDGSTQTSSSQGALITVAHDATLGGNGTAGLPLRVAVPLTLAGASPFGSSVLLVTSNDSGDAVQGHDSGNGSGVHGISDLGIGVHGESTLGEGLRALSQSGIGALVETSSTTPGNAAIVALGAASATGGAAGLFLGNVSIAGTPGSQNGDLSVSGVLSKGAGSFKIDHPLDPENKYLYHSFVESPDMKNIYDGNAVTNDNGDAVIQLPDWFEALNGDFRYQLTVIGAFAKAMVAEKIKSNRFVIKTDAPNVEVSWQVTGIRRDAFANRNRIPVEQDKPEAERGHYLHPDAFDQPSEKSVQSVRNPEMMLRLKRRGEEAARRSRGEKAAGR
jgi:hypothetical protein